MELATATRAEQRVQAPAADVLAALAVLAQHAGNASAASRVLGMSRKSLTQWRNSYRQEYLAIAKRMSAEVEEALITEMRESSALAVRGAKLAMQREIERIEAGEIKDYSASGKNLMLTAAIGTDKALLLEGRPTSIHAESTVDEDLRFLRSRAIDGEATEEN